ncbi:MAG: patatin-like phospholipase family protein [Bacteroidales bacterium]
MIPVSATKRSAALFFFAFVLFCHVQGQKTALVLSGGGAKGVVHIGVIKALEEKGIPIDYIAGTSMGAIVGGLYAAGYSPEQMEALVTSEEFLRWSVGELDEQYSYYFKEAPPDASWIKVRFDYNLKENRLRSKLPFNIISPYQMDFQIMDIFSKANAVAGNTFDSLFIPFRCVASDIENNVAVVMKKGHLSAAIRASMTIPFYFKPIEIDGILMFDGGMYNNFPADVAVREFQPNVIIGSKAAGNFNPPEEGDIMLLIQNMLAAKTQYDMVIDSAVLIEHELGKINILDFSQTKAFIDSGYRKTNRMIDSIGRFVTRRVDAEQVELRRALFNSRKRPYLIDAIEIKGMNKAQSRYVENILKHKDEIVSLEDLKNKYFELIADNKISYIFPQLDYDASSGFYKLLLNMKPVDNFQVRFGGNISSGSANEAFLGLDHVYLGRQAFMTSVNAYFGRFYSSFQGNFRVDFPSRLPFYFNVGYTYNHRNYFKSTTRFFEDPDPSFLIENENFVWAEAVIPVKNSGKLVGGMSISRIKEKYYQTNAFSRLDTNDITYFDFFSPRILLELNSLNYKQYANQGAYFSVGANYINGSEDNIPGSTSINKEAFSENHDWFQLKMVWDNYFERFGPVRLGFYGEVLLSNQPLFNNYTSTILASPAFAPVPESKVLFLPKYRAHNYAGAGLKVVTNVLKKVDFRLEAYLFQPYREIKQMPDQTVEYGKEFSNRSYIGTAALVWHSPIGPVSVSLNHYDRSNDQFTFFFNIGYILFNRSSHY